MQLQEAVVSFIKEKIIDEKLDIETKVNLIQQQWNQIENKAIQRMDQLFDATAQFENGLTAYLTFNTRCSYNFKGNYFFVSLASPNPLRTTVHELLHFYTHLLIEPLFMQNQTKAFFGEFKESLTVLLNSEFIDLIEEKDNGYSQHAATRDWIMQRWRQGMNVQELAVNYLKFKS